MLVFSEELAVILFSEKFRQSWEIMAYSILFLVFNFLLQINFQILAWVWQVKKRVKILSIWLLINIPLNIILIKMMWVAWSSLAVWLSWVPLFYLSHVATRKFNSKFDISFFMRNTVLSWILGYIIYLFKDKFIIDSNRIEMLIFILIILILYIIPFVFLNKNELKLFIGELKKIRASKVILTNK